MTNLYMWSYSATLNNRVVHGHVEAPNSTLAMQAVQADNELITNVRVVVDRSPTARLNKYIKWGHAA